MTKREAFYLADYYLSQGAEVGLGLWLAENTCEPALYPAELQLLLDWMREFHERGGRMTCCDLGAGPGISRQGGVEDADLVQIAAQLRETAVADPICVSAAPGVWLAGRRGMLITRVLAVKERERPMIVLDLPGPIQRWPASVPRQEMLLLGGKMDQVRQLRMYDVVGCGPSLRDRISDRQILPPVKPGDLIVLLGVGVHVPNAAIPKFFWSGGALDRLTGEPPYRVRAW